MGCLRRSLCGGLAGQWGLGAGRPQSPAPERVTATGVLGAKGLQAASRKGMAAGVLERACVFAHRLQASRLVRRWPLRWPLTALLQLPVTRHTPIVLLSPCRCKHATRYICAYIGPHQTVKRCWQLAYCSDLTEDQRGVV